MDTLQLTQKSIEFECSPQTIGLAEQDRLSHDVVTETGLIIFAPPHQFAVFVQEFGGGWALAQMDEDYIVRRDDNGNQILVHRDNFTWRVRDFRTGLLYEPSPKEF